MLLKIIFLCLTFSSFCFANETPSTVLLQLDNKTTLCGGTLIDVDFVILSASCVFDKTRTQIDAKALKIIDANETVKEVKQVFVHPKYNKVTLDNNIAVLHVDSFEIPSTLTTLVAPGDKKRCVIEDVEANKTIPIEIPNQSNCAKRLICVTLENECTGAGSILKCDNELAGVGLRCDKENNEIIFVDVSKYNNWIDQVFRQVVHEKKEKDMEQSSKENDESSEDDDLETDIDEEKEIMEECKCCYNDCYETWTQEYFSNQLTKNVVCKRGFYPYGCVYTVKHYISDQPSYLSPFNTFVTWLVHKHDDIMRYARNYYPDYYGTRSSVYWIR